MLEALFDFFQIGFMETLGSFNAAFEDFLGRIQVTSYSHVENYMTAASSQPTGAS